MKFSLVFALSASAALLGACGSHSKSEVSGVKDSRKITALGNGLFSVACNDGTTAIHTAEEVTSNQVCLVRAVLVQSALLVESRSDSAKQDCQLEKGTLLTLSTAPKAFDAAQVEVNFAQGFTLSGCSLTSGLLPKSSLRVISLPKRPGTPSYPSYPSYPSF